MLVKLTEAIHDPSTNRYSLREVMVDSNHVVAVREDPSMASALHEGRISDGLSSQTRFSRLYVGGGQYGLNLLIIGSPDLIQEKLSSSRTVLKG
jgi:hypothetical protein